MSSLNLSFQTNKCFSQKKRKYFYKNAFFSLFNFKKAFSFYFKWIKLRLNVLNIYCLLPSMEYVENLQILMALKLFSATLRIILIPFGFFRFSPYSIWGRKQYLLLIEFKCISESLEIQHSFVDYYLIRTDREKK